MPPRRRLRTLLVDNYDSYTFNLFQVMADVNGVPPLVVHNDDFASWAELSAELGSQFDAVVISPGPGHPAKAQDFGLCREVIECCDKPLLGVCLGHQGLGEVQGAKVVHAPRGAMHGRLSPILFDGGDQDKDGVGNSRSSLFRGLPDGFQAVRYHSLVIDEASLAEADQLQCLARTAEGDIMAVGHRSRPQWGVQFHPESIATEGGARLLSNFRDLALDWADQQPQPQWEENEEAGEDAVPSLTDHGTHYSDEDERSPSPYRTAARVVDLRSALLPDDAAATVPFTERVFARLFGEKAVAFWLDSATATSPTAFATATQAGPMSDAAVRARHGARFSFMGAGDGPLSERIEFRLDAAAANAEGAPRNASGVVTVLRPVRADDGELEEEVVERRTASLVDFLKRRLATLGQPPVELEGHEPHRGPATGPTKPMARSPGVDLPFEFDGGYVGFFSYEMRHEMERLLDGSGGGGGDGGGGGTLEHEFEPNRAFASTPDACWLLADRMLAFDHATGSVYLLALEDTAEAPDEDAVGAAAWLDAVERTLHDVAAEQKQERVRETLAKGKEQERQTATDPLPLRRLVTRRSAAQYADDVRACQAWIHDGETYEMCLTTRLSAATTTAPTSPATKSATPATSTSATTGPSSATSTPEGTGEGSGVLAPALDPLCAYRSLRQGNPAPYAAFLKVDPRRQLHNLGATATAAAQCDDGAGAGSSDHSSASAGGSSFALCCSSPERFLRVHADGWCESKPIKGTARRHLQDVSLDSAAAAELQTCSKERAENLMIVDLVRNDLGRVCRVGSVSVPKLMEVESFSTVHQLVSTIRGQLLPRKTALDAVAASFPGGSMTGAPKRRTMSLLHEVEGRHPRGVYSGSVGFLALGGAADLNIVIRSALIEPGTLSIGAGGAITALSDPLAEHDEMQLKAAAVVSALTGA